MSGHEDDGVVLGHEDDGVVLHLPAGADAPSIARQFVAGHATGLPASRLGDAELLVSEIVTNAVLHGRPEITLRVCLDPPRIGVAVNDRGTEMPDVSPDSPGATAPSGRGLLIVDTLATEWGVSPNFPPPGKTVWFQLGGTPD